MSGPRSASVSSVTVVHSMIHKGLLEEHILASSSVPPSYDAISPIRAHIDRFTSVSESSEIECSLNTEHLSPWREFWIHIAPTSWQELKQQHPLNIIWRILVIPIQIILAITVPVVDFEHEKNNWCKPLNVINCITAPMTISFVIFKNQQMYGVPVPIIGFVIGVVLATAVIWTSTNDQVPKYHFGFALLAFFTGVCFIYAACRELIAVLKAVGIDRHIDDSVLGLTVLAWGSSIGDLITDSMVAKQGYPEMAIAAAFAGPMLNLLIGLGSAFSVRLLREGTTSIHVECPPILFVLYAALNSSLIVSFLFLSCTGFRSSSTHSIMLMVLYLTFISIAVAMTMHPYMLPKT